LKRGIVETNVSGINYVHDRRWEWF